MATSNFFLGCIDINQAVQLFEAEAPTIDMFPSTNYKIEVPANMKTLLGLSGSYQQNAEDPNAVNITLTAAGNEAYLKELLGYDKVYNDDGTVVANYVPGATGVSVTDRKGATTGILTGTNYNIGFRLLEIAAIQIFNHAKARAAIRNDTAFKDAMQSVVDETQTKITGYDLTGETKLEIFNHYKRQFPNSEANDVDASVAFNFDEFNFLSYATGIQINFNMPSITDSAATEVDKTAYGIEADPTVTILLRFAEPQ
jgi:hypothetical protein